MRHAYRAGLSGPKAASRAGAKAAAALEPVAFEVVAAAAAPAVAGTADEPTAPAVADRGTLAAAAGTATARGGR